jgi:hypothetical protein
MATRINIAPALSLEMLSLFKDNQIRFSQALREAKSERESFNYNLVSIVITLKSEKLLKSFASTINTFYEYTAEEEANEQYPDSTISLNKGLQ